MIRLSHKPQPERSFNTLLVLLLVGAVLALIALPGCAGAFVTGARVVESAAQVGDIAEDALSALDSAKLDEALAKGREMGSVSVTDDMTKEWDAELVK